MKKTVAVTLIVFAMLVGSSGCSVMEQIQQRLAIQNCKFNLVNARAHSFSFADMLVDLDIAVSNPNPIAVIIDKLDLLLFINDRETLSAGFGGDSIQTNETRTLTTTLRIPYLKVGMALVDIIRRQENVRYRLDGYVNINSAYGVFRFPVTIYKNQ